MAGSHAIRYLPVAVDDLLSIYDRISVDSPARAKEFTDKLDKRIGNLSTHPLLGRIPKQENLRLLGYRVLAVESYLVFYIIKGTTVEVHRVIHGSRNLDDLV
jgi:toxin ParE1/3/4